MLSHKQLKKELFGTNILQKKSYNEKDLFFEIADMIFEARLKKGLTQKKLAQKIKTKQTSIARLERGNSLPSLTFLYKISKALDAELIPPKFKFKGN